MCGFSWISLQVHIFFVPEGIHDRRALENSHYFSFLVSIPQTASLILCVLDVGLAGRVLFYFHDPPPSTQHAQFVLRPANYN